MRGSRKGRSIRLRLWKWLGLPAAAFLIVFVFPLGAVVHHVFFDRDGLPSLGPVIRFDLPAIGTIYDAEGNALFELAREYRRMVTFDEIPPVVRNAILSAEDKTFFSHSGIDYRALARVFWKNLVRPGRHATQSGHGLVFSQGGSTITQQLVRGYFLPNMTSREKSDTLSQDGFLSRLAGRIVGASATNKLVRKMEEIRLSVWLEEGLKKFFGSRKKAKEEILARYASLLYMGNGRYGIAAASEYYFGKPLSSYTVDDVDKAALLAGIIKCPRDCAPSPGNLDRALRRRNKILDLMVGNHFVETEAAQRYRRSPVHLPVREVLRAGASAVVESVFAELKRLNSDRFSIEHFVQGRILVHSTAQSGIQAITNEALENGLRRFEKRHIGSKGLIQGSVVVLGNADAKILAESGGRQIYRERSSSHADFNRASNSLRQPGSTMKPFVYLAAFRLGVTLDTEIPDDPISVLARDKEIKWIRNYDDGFKGAIAVRQALAESRNAATTWIAQKIGITEVVKTAQELGISSPLRPHLSLALGASEVRLVELANAYRAMASEVVAEPYMIQRITDAAGSDLFVAKDAVHPLEIDRAALWDIQEGLRGVIRLPGGTAHSLNSSEFAIPIMGKTGTSNDFRDALFVGSTYGSGGITVAVRVGYDDNRKLGEKETGARVALPIFKEIMLAIYKRELVGPVPQFPAEMEKTITEYITCAAKGVARDSVEEVPARPPPMAADPAVFADDDSAQGIPSTMARCSRQRLALSVTAFRIVR